MNNCAIVCEYNPFHTGHKYQIDAVRPHVDNIVCVMSGQFVQSALPAFCDKSIRAECAVLGGANAVIELPTVYATASAQYFAEGAIKIISHIKDVRYMAMGASATRDELFRLAELKLDDRFTDRLKSELKSGKSYNAATAAALTSLCEPREYDMPTRVLADPNNILCLEYIATISRNAPHIQPMIIKRVGAEYNDLSLDNEYVSASAIREGAKTDFDGVKRFIPFMPNEMQAWRNSHRPDIDAYKKIAIFALKCATVDYIRDLRNCSEGMEYLLKNMSDKSDFDSITDSAECRRYGKKRIQRLILDIVLDIDKNVFEKKFCTRLLACRKDFDYSVLPDFVKTNNRDIKAASADPQTAHILEIDRKSVALYNTLCGIDGNYYNYSLVKL